MVPEGLVVMSVKIVFEKLKQLMDEICTGVDIHVENISYHAIDRSDGT